MRLTLFLLLLLAISSTVSAQWAIPQQLRAQQTLDRISDKDGIGRSDMLYGIPAPPGRVIGDTYLDRKWNSSSILLYESDKLIEGYPVKYDIKSDLVEINSKSGIKVVDARKVKSLVWVDSLTNVPKYLVNGKDFRLEGNVLNGLLEVVVDGNFPLIKRTTIFEKQPDYVPAFDMGSRDKKILKREALYYLQKNELVKVTNKKSLLAAFGDQADEVDAYMKANKLSTGNEKELADVFRFYNSKVTTNP